MKHLSSTLSVAAALLLSSVGARADVTLVMFRHAEKPEAGLGQLNCQGLNRALALPDVLLPRFGKPAALYAPDPGYTTKDRGKRYNYIRPLATIEPTAIRLGMPVETQWGLKNIRALRAELLSRSHEGQVLYVAWEHRLLEQLARDIVRQRGGDPAGVPEWASDDFDSIYVVSLPTKGDASFRVEQEGLNGQSLLCPGQK